VSDYGAAAVRVLRSRLNLCESLPSLDSLTTRRFR
jgi:hypothetical protein